MCKLSCLVSKNTRRHAVSLGRRINHQWRHVLNPKLLLVDPAEETLSIIDPMLLVKPGLKSGFLSPIKRRGYCPKPGPTDGVPAARIP